MQIAVSFMAKNGVETPLRTEISPFTFNPDKMAIKAVLFKVRGIVNWRDESVNDGHVELITIKIIN